MNKQNVEGSRFTIFYSYTPEDEVLRDELETHLALLLFRIFCGSELAVKHLQTGMLASF